MSKRLAVAALTAALAVCGCKMMDKDKDEDTSSSPKKMSVDKNAKGTCTSCDKAK